MSTQSNSSANNAQALGASDQYGFQSGAEGQQAYLPATLGGMGTTTLNADQSGVDPSYQASLAQALYNVPSTSATDWTGKAAKATAATSAGMSAPTQQQTRMGGTGAPRLQAQNFSSGLLSLPQTSSNGNQALLALMQQLKG